MYYLKAYIDGNTVFYSNSRKSSSYSSFTPDLSNSLSFSSRKIANIKLNEINDSRFFIISVCPICNKEFDEPPAISRKDNKTEICSDCAIGEAMKAFFDSYKK